jgi:hypothetical protein
MLGVALRLVRVWQPARLRTISASDPRLDIGFHAFEPDNGWRWTSGEATLPTALFAGLDAGCQLELLVADGMRSLARTVGLARRLRSYPTQDDFSHSPLGRGLG